MARHFGHLSIVSAWFSAPLIAGARFSNFEPWLVNPLNTHPLCGVGSATVYPLQETIDRDGITSSRSVSPVVYCLAVCRASYWGQLIRRRTPSPLGLLGGFYPLEVHNTSYRSSMFRRGGSPDPHSYPSMSFYRVGEIHIIARHRVDNLDWHTRLASLGSFITT